MFVSLLVVEALSVIADGQPAGQPGEECCDTKLVGGISYTLTGQMDTQAYKCLNDCVYQKEGDTGMMYCFAMGDEMVECQDEEGRPTPPTGGGDEGSPTPPAGGVPTQVPGGPTQVPGGPTQGPGGATQGQGPATQKTLPWFLGMDPMELCVETGTEVVFNKTGHNVVLMANQADYDACTGFLGENPTVGNNIDPFIWQADTDGTFYFACGVGSHCSAGGMKAKITVAPNCPMSKTLPWTFGMQPQVVCVETGTTVIFDKTGSGHNVNQLASESEYNGCTGFTDTQGNSDNPFLYQADSTGVFYFACGVGSGFHCNNGGMKAMVTVADACLEE